MSAEEAALDRARRGDEQAFHALIAPHRPDLLGHCYRMTGSLAEAEDAVQEAMLRAWKGLTRFEGRASLRTWLRTIATRSCLDALESRPERTLPTASRRPSDPEAPMAPPLEEVSWLDPAPDSWFSSDSPEERYSLRESVGLAFLVALQKLPARQRAVLLMREVLGMAAAEVAEALDTTVASVNSALQRARELLAADRATEAGRATPGADLSSEAHRELLARYVAVWEQADAAALIGLLCEDAMLSMPPFADWFLGPRAIVRSMVQMVLPPEARGRFRLLSTAANGMPALACYERGEASGPYRPSSIQLLRFKGDRIAEIVAFLKPELFPHFGLPAALSD